LFKHANLSSEFHNLVQLTTHNNISPTLNYAVHPESSVYPQISQLVTFLTSETIIYKSKSAHITSTSS